MATVNKCAVMTAPNKLVIEERPVPEIAEDEVLVRVEWVGICGSDVHLFRTGKQGDNVATEPMILGHEASGVIAATGSTVANVEIGDRVAIEPGEVCGKCFYCKSGRYNLCEQMVFPSTPPVDGAFVTYMKVPDYGVYRLPDNVSTRHGALMEPLAVALQNTKRGGVQLGSTVVIIGSGTIGLMNLLCSKMKGASKVIVTDVTAGKLKTAMKLGATETINVLETNVEQAVNEITGGQGADVVIDCSGTVSGLQLTPALTRPGGNIVLVGMPGDDIVGLNVTSIIWKELNIFGSFRYENNYGDAINAVSGGLIDLELLISREFQLDNIERAFKYVIDNAEDVIKAVVRV